MCDFCLRWNPIIISLGCSFDCIQCCFYPHSVSRHHEFARYEIISNTSRNNGTKCWIISKLHRSCFTGNYTACFSFKFFFIIQLKIIYCRVSSLQWVIAIVAYDLLCNHPLRPLYMQLLHHFWLFSCCLHLNLIL